MSRDPFLRLALIALTTAYVVGLLIVADHFGAWAAALGATLSVFVAMVLTLEHESPPTRDELKEQLRPQRPRTDSEGRPQGFERI